MKFIKTNNSGRRFFLANYVLIQTLFLTALVLANNSQINSPKKGIIGIWHHKRTIIEKQTNQPKVFLPVRETPESIILAVEEGVNEITINEGFKEFIHTQTLPTDGSFVTKNIQNLGKVITNAIWIGGKLVVEFRTSKGEKLTEKFELSPNQKQLNVTLEFVGSNFTKTKLRRVYQRGSEFEEKNVAQIGIASYPF